MGKENQRVEPAVLEKAKQQTLKEKRSWQLGNKQKKKKERKKVQVMLLEDNVEGL